MIDEQHIVKVGMADLNVIRGQGLIRTTGLGSCVGVTLFDPMLKVAGLAHVMLPSSEIAREGALNLAKYADTALPELVRRLSELGVTKSRLIAKMAGGSQMFTFAGKGDSMRIGPRNVESCKVMLNELGIPLVAEDTGGNYGRTIELDCETGILFIRSVQMGIKEL
ncbi:chemoreceptor glutamine deamidase CheD [Paenibacillus faecis]|uniref:Probable chemoreceptor glutamine deamidase CheD n=1 Tax=Paenibacillus faecis TaxID=862114 RepID=A0A5D0CWM2_9BACL|nr:MULTISPECIES: chemotaxis protein CheD [Paenibacillus]MCA1294201.1 chemotaxis protein CheD [Paenibacillus sp. alder61]TYA14332.1 chemotaxis protein CheD [Paenibacillus faecis]GIO83820.1 chemoreceptor glutamine deamidase CheD [Paenibacillus faecis]